MNVNMSLVGMDKLLKKFKELGDVPQRAVQLAARKGAVYVQRIAKNSPNTPVDTGNLRRGIKIFGERSRKKAKKMYFVAFDYKMNAIFQKYNASAKAKKAAGQKVSPSAYYPASQEYGWRKANGQRQPGRYFLRNSLGGHRSEVQKIIVDTMINQVQKVIDKG